MLNGRCIRPTAEELEDFGTPDFTIYNAGQFPCNRYTHYMTSSTSIDMNLARKEMVILGTQYAGEMKKGLFSLMHYLMPKRQILSLHSGCNMGKDGDVALFFGLSGMCFCDLIKLDILNAIGASVEDHSLFWLCLYRYWKNHVVYRS